MQTLRYWIHGPKGCGKTELATRITNIPPDAHIIGYSTTAAALRRQLSSSKVAVIESYRPDNKLDQVLRSAALNQSMTIGKAIPTTERKKIHFDIDVLVVISEQPPTDAALASRFFLIEITPARRG